MQALALRLRKQLSSELSLALIRTFIARGTAALGGVLLVFVLGRLYGPAGVGAFALAQSFSVGAGLLAKYGMDNALMRYVAQESRAREVVTYLRWSCARVLLFSVAAATTVYLARHQLARILESPWLIDLLPAIALAVPATSVAYLFAGFLKGIRKPATACMMEAGSVSLVTSLILLASSYLHLSSDIATAGWAFALSAWLVVVQGGAQIAGWIVRTRFTRSARPVSYTEFMRSSTDFFVLSFAQIIQQFVGVLIAGFLLSSSDLGLFKAAERIALVISFALIVINSVLPPMFAELHHKGDKLGLERVAKGGALTGLLVSSPFVFACVFIPDRVLGLIGEDFISASGLLRLLAISHLVNVACGSVGFLLNMTGHEKIMRNIALSCGILGVGSYLLLIPVWGVHGAALALAVVLIAQNVVASIFVVRLLGICTIPGLGLFFRQSR